MFSVDNDMTISITRGDVAKIPVSAVGEAFKLGDIIRIKVFEKKNCANVIFQKDFGVAEETEKAHYRYLQDNPPFLELGKGDKVSFGAKVRSGRDAK